MIRPDLKAIPAYVAGARNDDALKLSSNEAAHPPLPEAAAAMAEAVTKANRYPDIAATALREDLAAHLGVEYGQVAVGTGSSALCQQLVEIAATPGEEVLFPWRSFEAYPIFAQVVGAHPIPVPLGADQRVDLPAMAHKITDKTRLIFVCNPNNPSGTTVTKEEFAAFMDAVPADVLVALDEAYIEYNRATNIPLGTELVGTYPNLVCLRTFSKAYGLAGCASVMPLARKILLRPSIRWPSPSPPAPWRRLVRARHWRRRIRCGSAPMRPSPSASA